ncbi:MAG TPA: DUF1015 domain-containing protein [Candidatus Limnocylindria bacterium]|nr:DUF1015 domain-containing protein [Candidatus Limnocylindria bacterium]
MPRVAAFRGLHYPLERFGGTRIPERVRLPDEGPDHPGRVADLTDLACPPYDVIAPRQRDELLARHPWNAVRLELSAEPEPHAAAAATLAAWRADGVLAEAPAASIYYYAHAAAHDPDRPAVHGVLCRVLLEPWGADVRPHEHTMPGPKDDRLRLLRATRTQLSPILALYFDRSERYRHVMSRAWSDEWRARDADGLLHTLAAVEPDERLVNYLSRQRLFVADGHHRYETALAYRAEVRAETGNAQAAPGALAADWIMAVLVNAQLEELEIRPTHRILADADPDALRRLVDEPGPLFAAERVPSAALATRLAERRDGAAPVFGLVLPGDEAYLLTGQPDALEERMRQERTSTAVRRLDLAVLHAAILGDRLGIGRAEVAAGRVLAYTRDAGEALDRVRSGTAAAAVLVRATRLDQLAAVATAGDVMPQKSTFFHPKLVTGLVFNPLDDERGA